MAGRLPPGVNAFHGGLEQILPRPALCADFLSQEAARKPGVDAVKARVPVVMALDCDPGLVPRVIFRLVSQNRAVFTGCTSRRLDMRLHGENQRPLRQRVSCLKEVAVYTPCREPQETGPRR